MEAVVLSTSSAAGAADAHEAAAPAGAATAAATSTTTPQRTRAAALAPVRPAGGRGIGEGGGEDEAPATAAAKPLPECLRAAERGTEPAERPPTNLAAPEQQAAGSPAGGPSAGGTQQTHAATGAAPSLPQQKKCTRPGCGKKYFDAENTAAASACVYHAAMPIFHDGVKRWPCCSREAWDWEEFMQIPGCARGIHADAKESCTSRGRAVATPTPSATPTPAAAAVKVLDIEEFNRQQRQEEEARRAREAAAAESAVPRLETPFVTAEGKYKCVNKGCNKEYFPEENRSDACSFHPGKPIFRDCMKSWTCCNAKSYDWDEFMQLPPCQRGHHSPKMVAQ